MADKPIGTMFVELDLDASRYTKGQQQLLKDAQTASTTLEKNFQNLGIKSAGTFDLMRAKTINSFEAIAKSSRATADDIIRAEEAKNAKLQQINDQQFGKQTSIIETLKKNWIAAAAAVYASVAAIGKAMDMAEAGSKLQKQEASFESLAKAAGTSSSQILDSLKRVSQGMVSEARLIWASGKALLMGLPAADITKYMEIAAATSKSTGQTVTEAFADITLGVARQSKMILDNLGIIISVEKANEDYARVLGKTADALTDAEKRQAFANATLKAGEDMIRRIGSSQSTLDGAAKATAEWSTAMDGLSKMIAEKSNPLFEAVAGVLKRINMELKAGQDAAKEYGASFESVNARIEELNKKSRRPLFSGDSTTMEARLSSGWNEPEDQEYRRLLKLREAYRTQGTTDFGRGNVMGRYGSFEPEYHGSRRVAENEIAYDAEARWKAYEEQLKKEEDALKKSIDERNRIWGDYKPRYAGSQQDEAMLADEKAMDAWKKSWEPWASKQRLPESQRSEAELADEKAMEEWKKKTKSSFDAMTELSQETARAMQSNFSDFFFDSMTGEFKSLGDYATAMFRSIQKAAADMAGQFLTQKLFGAQSTGGTAGGGGWLSDIAGWIGGMVSSGSTAAAANGLAFSHAGVVPFARGGIVNRPTVFPFARGGVGVMGESGPEAIMPLKRDSSGRLGVSAGASAMNVTINVAAPTGRLERESLNHLQTALAATLQRASQRNT